VITSIIHLNRFFFVDENEQVYTYVRQFDRISRICILCNGRLEWEYTFSLYSRQSSNLLRFIRVSTAPHAVACGGPRTNHVVAWREKGVNVTVKYRTSCRESDSVSSQIDRTIALKNINHAPQQVYVYVYNCMCYYGVRRINSYIKTLLWIGCISSVYWPTYYFVICQYAYKICELRKRYTWRPLTPTSGLLWLWLCNWGPPVKSCYRSEYWIFGQRHVNVR
jgi:hypothetical protein